ncbi:DsbA family oxidoreductase [Asticcacaulis taihuensis]|uniref:Predicted dithiol-disulfide isomerase, DsbA family n=1 Tax=Asticcacaulis taihuensis TaxID=260084 RepID=A0A1G4ST35_9CAUL|nr:DsbA family oxidoreductase [Asticcacaulis taihuensis]SCW72362.1 Predicted dithiol-disulfide isomerase, DsbA family [Asticcacaulis taihuensis]
MKIEIWSDVICPFCYIGKAELETALKQWGGEADISHRSFRLSPGQTVIPTDLMLQQKYGMSPQQVSANQAQVTARAAQAGLEFHLDGTLAGDTTDAHRLIALAQGHGKQTEAVDRLYRAYFTDGRNIFDRAVLHEIGAELGLAAADIDAAFTSSDIDMSIALDQRQAQVYGVHGVPFVVVDGKYAVSGAQPVAAFLQTLQAAETEAKKNPVVEGDACGHRWLRSRIK